MTYNLKNDDYKKLANAVRSLSIDAINKANSGHPGLPLGMADVISVLFSKFLKFYPDDPSWAIRDRFILSAGHGSAMLYSLLYLLGYKKLSLPEIKNFRQLGSVAAGHPEYYLNAGIEMTTGPLGQGLASAVGIAIAEKINSQRYTKNNFSHYTYVLAGDGCLMEGLSYEATSIAGHLNLNKLIVLWDDNEITIDGHVSVARTEDMKMRFKSIDWDIYETDAYDIANICCALENAKKSLKPSLIICKSQIGYGSPNMAGSSKAHGSPLGEEEARKTKNKLNIDYKNFDIPKDILDLWRDIGNRYKNKYLDWKNKYKEKKLFDQDILDKLIFKLKSNFLNLKLNIATRKASHIVLEDLISRFEDLIGGSADLSESNLTKVSLSKSINKKDFSGNYLHYGIREHAMGSIMNGLALSGFIPYGGTFLCFSDYMRAAIRMSALMRLQVIYVMTHDSIGLGEDGPTHQPVEHLAAIRAIPNILVLRPANAIETAESWQIALSTKDRPSVLVLTRQKTELRERYDDDLKENKSLKGAYIYSKGNIKLKSKICIWASGSELNLALDIADKLEKNNIGSRVVSVVSFELFRMQDIDYINRLKSKDLIHIGIEAAVKQGWEEIIGDGMFFGISNFGLSAPKEELFKYFNLTADDIYKSIIEKINLI